MSNSSAAPTVSIVGVVLAILMIVALWKIFKKAGERPWKALIPIYNVYTQYKFTWSGKEYWKRLLISILVSVFAALLTRSSGAAYVIFLILTILGGIYLIVHSIKAYRRLAGAFGYGVGFTVGLIFLTPIFTLILGFGKAPYIGKYDPSNR